MPPINLYELGFDKVYIKIINSSNYISIRLVFVQLSDTVMVGQIGSRDLAAKSSSSILISSSVSPLASPLMM